jgi:hypothetical protein
MEDKVEHIKGAKLVNGVWLDLEGNLLSNADLVRLREAQEKEKADRAKERERTQRQQSQ